MSMFMIFWDVGGFVLVVMGLAVGFFVVVGLFVVVLFWFKVSMGVLVNGTSVSAAGVKVETSWFLLMEQFLPSQVNVI